jgi:hypothetical protein
MTMRLTKKEPGKPGVPEAIRMTDYIGWQENGVLRKWYEGDVERNPRDIEALLAHNAPHEVLQ